MKCLLLATEQDACISWLLLSGKNIALSRRRNIKRLQSFYEIWTKKEAYLKRLGTGLIDNISTINVLEECMENKLHTGWFGDYVWTVCHKTCNMVYKVVDEKDIWNYYNKTVKDTI